ncbi:hypothetical protein Pmani_003599 [Petrolisthes manimaculis]|uniref:Uncharacterized protein n=1 Tax=Petrolisthes manimaculis TaxID=1843537 RepID=A0AAE1UPU3_9EUCA|nr:hypothetical protein Pmani_003599 [Petrolisthes manimaculis]
MQTTYLLLSFTLLISSVAATLTLFETKELMEKNERCLFSSCLRETSYLSNKHQTVVHKKPKETEPPLKVEDTLAHQASKTSASLTAYSAVMTGIKLVAKFFHTTETTETTENYWDELRDTISAMVDYALDDSILQQTNAAVEMLSEDLQLYLDVSNTTGGAFSAIALCQKMDTQLINILATYSGMSMKERGVLHYLDMATTRLMLWQTTAFRYIADYTVHGQLDSGMMVCDIVRKWSLAYNSETRLIREDQMTALTDWVSNFVDEKHEEQEVAI